MLRSSTVSSYLKFLSVLFCILFVSWKSFSQQVVTQTFTANGTFTPPAGVTKVKVECWGGGGGGGGANSNASENRAGGGGAGGSYTLANSVTVVPSTPITVTVGAGGAAGDGGDLGGPGSAGGTSTFSSGTPVSAVGGAGGAFGTSGDVCGNGGATTAGVTSNGGAGGEAPPGGTAGPSTGSGGGGGSGGSGGAGGAASGATAGTAGAGGGGAGAAGLTGIPSGTTGIGNNATQVGGGGSGGWDNLSDNNVVPGAKGGDGFRGQVIVSYTLPTAAITYSDADGIVKAGDILTITATFSEPIADAPVMQISLSGANTLALTNMVKSSTTVYTYAHTVGAGNGTVTVSLGTGVSANGNIVHPTPTSGATFTVDNTAPTSTASYTKTSVKNGDGQTVTLTFNENLTVTPKITITAPSGTVVNNQDMTMGGNSTIWSYNAGTTWTGDGTATVTVGTGTDVAGNVVASTPSNNTFTVDNTAPTSAATYTQSNVKNGFSQTITLTFNEALSVTPKITVTGPPGTVVNNQDMSGGPTVWTYTHSVWTGDGMETVTVGTGADAAGNIVTSTPSNNTFTVDNIAPTSAATYTQTLLKNGTSQTITLTFSEALTVTPKITVTGPPGTVVNDQSMSGGPTVWTYTHSVWTGDGTETVTVGTGTDAAGNVVNSTPTTNTFTVDNTAPGLTLTLPAASSFVNHTLVTYTLNETLQSGFIRWTRTAGTADATIHTQNLTGAELTTNQTNYTLSNNPTLTAGSIYTVLFSGTDAAGNTGTVSNTVVEYDVTAPGAFTVGAVVTTGGTVVATKWNGTNTGVDVTVPIANEATLNGGILQIEARISSGSFAPIGSSSAIAAINTNKTISLSSAQINAITGYAQGVILQFRAVITDRAGNSTTGTQSATTLTVDTVAPTISTSSFNANGSGRETIVLTFSETLNLTSGLPVSTTTSGNPGFFSNPASVRTSGSTAFTVSGVTLESSNNGNWSSSVQITYTKSNNAVGNYVRDLAGNELATITFVPNATPPQLASSMVLDPNGAGNEIITFVVDQTLNLANGATVTGLTVNGTGFNGIYTLATNTITLTSTSNGLWAGSALVSYTPGNIVGSTGASMGAFTNEPILLSPLSISSNNGVNTSFAKVGDVVTLSFTANRTLSATPTVTIDGVSATVSGSNPYTASITTTSGNNTGVFVWQIVADETSRSSTISKTINGSTVTFDKTAPTVTVATIASNNVNTAYAKSGDVVTISFTVSETLSALPTATIGGNTATVASAGGLNYTASVTTDNTYTNGVLPFNISISDVAGNTGSRTTTTNASSVTFDKTNPTVQSISLPSADPNNTGSVDFTVVFSESVTGVNTTDFTTYGTASGGGETIGVAGSGTTYTVTVSGISLTGTLGLSVVDDNTIADVADNRLGGALLNDGNFSSATTYLIILPQPPNHVTGFSITSTNYTSMQLAWTDAIGSPAPSGYLIAVERSGATATVPSDGTPIANQTNLIASTTGYLNVGPGVQFASFPTMLSGETYTFHIYPYTNSGTNIDYKINGVIPSAGGTTPVDNFVWINNQSPLEASSFPSTTTSSGVAVVNFRFQVYDNGWGSADNASTKITAINIRRDLVNDQIGNWFDALQSVELTDGVTTKTGTIDAGGNFITFSGLYNGTTEFFGEVADNANKYYMLKVILKTGMGGNLPQTIDNKGFVFEIRNADLTLATNSSTLNAGNDTHPSAPSSVVGNNKVTVAATQLDFSTNPNAAIFVLTNVTSASAAPDFSTRPVVRARDLNGNTDLDYTTTVTITNAQTLPMSGLAAGNKLTPVAGVVTFPVNFQYTDDGTGAAGNGTLTVSDGTITNATSTSVTVTYSNTSTITTGAFVEPVTFSSLRDEIANYNIPNNRVFDFNVVDDNGAGGDGSPTRISQVVITQGTGNDVANWTQAIYGAVLYDGTFSIAASAINPTNITFSGINIANLGLVGDNATKNYQLYILLRSGMGGTLPATIDNLNLVFEVLDDNVTLTSTSSLFTGSEDENSGATNVAIDVVTTRMNFITQPPADVLVNTDLTTVPVVEAQDKNGNRDLNYSPVTGITVTNTGGLSMINPPTSFTNGILTFPSNFRYTQVGNGALTLNSTTLAPTAANSGPVNVRVGISSTITAGATAEPATISSLTTTAPGTQVFDFTINDDGGAENDGNPTQLTYLYITSGAGNEVTNWFDAVAGATLSDGVNTVPVAFIDPSNYFAFDLSSVAGQALGLINDNASKTFKLNIWLKATMGGTLPLTIDGMNFTFNVQQANIFTSASSTSIIAGQTLNSEPSLPVQFNEVTVVATQLDVTSPVAASFVSINTPFLPVLEARDANQNRDLDFEGASGTITAFTNASGATMSNGPVVGTTQFTDGIISFSSLFPNFKFTSGNNNDDVTLSIKAGTGTTCGTNAICSTLINPTLTLKTNTITAGAFLEPATISSLSTFAPGVSVFDFTINDDDNQPIDTDSDPTRISQIVITQLAGNDIANWTELIASATLSTPGFGNIPGTVNAANITFSGIGNVPGAFGYIGDNLSRTFTLNIVLKSSLGGTLPSTVDNLNAAFEVLATNITVALPSSTFSASETENSGAVNNAVSVVTTLLKFTTDMTSPLLPNKDISLQQSVPVIQAVDINNNRDLDYNSTTINVTNGGAIGMANVPATNSLTAGLLTFPASFRYTQVGNGTLTVSTSNFNSLGAAVASAVSASVTVQAGLASTITAGAAAPATFSSLTTASSGTTVFNFVVNDDPAGTPAAQDDGNPTQITQIIISKNIANNTITDWSQALAGAQLTDGTNTLLASSITANTIVFSSIPITSGTLGYIADDNTKTYTLKVWLKTALGGTLPTTIDGLRMAFEITNVGANVTTSLTGTSLLASQVQHSGTSNVVTVVATQLDITTPSSSANASISTDFPGSGASVIVQARDVNANRDLDFNGKITAFGNQTNATTINGPVLSGGSQSAFANGVFTFNTNFQFTSGSNTDVVTINTFKADNTGGNSGVDCTPGTGDAICLGISPSIVLQTSFESSLVLDPTFTIPATIPYLPYQEASNIQATGTSYTLLTALLVDGSRGPGFTYGGMPLNTNTDSGDGVANGDNDGANTVLTSITVRIYRPSNLRRIALYGNGAEIAGTEIDVTGIGAITSATSYYDFTWSAASLLAAIDDSQSTLSIRVSFRNTSPEVTDQDDIQVQLMAATVGTGSQFFVGAGYIGGQPNSGGAGSFGKIDVVATKLDFTTQPGVFAGINEPVATGVIKARDQYNLVDLEFNYSAAIATSSSGPSIPAAATSITSSPFVSGVLNLNGLQYTSVGDGTLTITSNSLSSNTNNVVGGLPNISVPCNHVDVINVFTTLATAGVVSSPNLAGGAVNKVVFGATFNAPYRIAAHPYLNKFIISFSNTITGVFKNFRVFESTDNAFGGDIEITNVSIGGKITAAAKSLTIDFTQAGGVPRNLSSVGGTSQLTYFLMVDVDPTANSATPSIQPYIEDLGFSDPLTNSNIITTNGSTYSLDNTSAVGKTKTPGPYTFAAIFPPTLTSSNPANGQLNVDPNKPTIDLVFSVPVWTLDGVISLYDKNTNTLVQTLTAANGQYAGGTTANLVGTVATPMKFNLPPLLSNHVYYITITPAKFNGSAATDNVGIMDENANLFPGFSYSGTLYFKTANTNPPILLSAAPAPAPSITNVSSTSAVINATFDQRGTAYFMVVSQGGSAPTNAQIKNPGTNPYPSGLQVGTAITTGNFQINQTNTISQFGLISANMALNTTYDVWMYAENDALPTPYATSSPYGGAASSYAAGGTGPTLSFTTPSSASTNVTVNAPIITICTNSYQILNAPIIISEGNTSNFTSSGVQTFNLLLPSGFQFDVSATGGVPTYGTLALLGSDFVAGSGSLKFINNSILQVSYTNNNTSTSSDNIIIYGLRVLAASTANGNVVRLGGNALASGAPSQILADLTPVANLNASDANTIDFTNSYSSITYPAKPVPVTFIPDNYDDPNITAPLLVQLDPLPPVNDFGPSIFSGPGVNVNQLSLTAVTLGSPFNIIVTHTDNNGCISNNPIQYTVYDHTKAIGGMLTSYGIVNSNFPAAASTGVDVKKILFNNIVANYMLSMTADIPVTATPVNTANPQPTDQIMYGTDWKALVATLPVAIGTATTPVNGSPHDPGNNPVFGQLYYDYQFDVSTILNANSLSSGAISEPYNNFKKTTPIQGNFFFTGGSLGLVEFTANYQSIANSILQFPLKQNVEFFLPSIPIVELGQANRSFLDTNDPLNPVGSGNVNPVGTGNANKGTQIFCEQGGTINITGYPNAVQGISTGAFSLWDASSNTLILPTPSIPNPTLLVHGFVDNGNGTASIDPAKLSNNFKDIKIVYTYRQDIAPINTKNSGYQVIRITPNPVAKFTTSTPACVGLPVTLNGSTSDFGAATGFTFSDIKTLDWTFGDATNSTGANPDVDQGVNVSHIYTASANYNPTLVVTSIYNCVSQPHLPKIVSVGAVPTVDFAMTGVSSADQFSFIDQSTVSSAAAVNDGIGQALWSFGDNTTSTINNPGSGSTVTHNYAASYIGVNTSSLQITSVIGCSASKSKQIVILPRVANGTGEYTEDFESGNVQWQTLPIKTSTSTSWQRGAVSKTFMKLSPANGNNVWATSLTGPFQQNEQSALYSPSFDISGLLRPMISFNSFVDLDKSDGVIIEYSVDNRNVADPNKQWFVLGNGVNEGLDWFNDQNLSGSPGVQTNFNYGWSIKATTASKWLESKHGIINQGNGKPDLIGVNRVVFRLALGSSTPTAPTTDGFAIDNFRIGNRTRIVLLENFTNLGNETKDGTEFLEDKESAFLKTFNPSGTTQSIVKINYYVGFPKQDPLNMDNAQDPGARALYYNVSQTPRVKMDGEGANAVFSAWGTQLYSVRSLKLADAEITPQIIYNADGSIDVSVGIKALKDLGDRTILQVAIVEKAIDRANLLPDRQSLVKRNETQYEYVLKKLLPSAAGTRFNQILPVNQSRTFGPFQVTEDMKLYNPINDLAVVVFLQNEQDTNGAREVYQTEILDLNDPSITTGIEDLNTSFNVYPIPTDKEMVIELPEPAEKRIALQMFDQMGKEVHQSHFEKGDSSKNVNTSEFAAGVYLIQIDSPKGVLRRKVMVVHHN